MFLAQACPTPTAPRATMVAAPDTWGDLMVAAQGGNGGAYRRLLAKIDPWLRRFYARRLPHAMVEDAAQEALIAIHARRHTYEPPAPFVPGWRRSRATSGSTGCAR